MIITFRGRKVGTVIGDTYFLIKKPEHFMGIFQGFGISQEVLDKLENVKKIKVLYMGIKGNVYYLFPIEDYINSKLIWKDKNEDIQKFVKAKGYEVHQ